MLAPVAEALTSVVEIIVALVRDFKASFAYIKGFDAYTVQVRSYSIPCSLPRADHRVVAAHPKGDPREGLAAACDQVGRVRGWSKSDYR